MVVLAAFSGQMMKINTDIEKKICDRVRDGQNIWQISKEMGIPRSTLYNWLCRGRAEKRGVYRNFFMSFERARRERQATLIQIAIQTVSQDRWTQKQLASALGITPRTLQNYFRRGEQGLCAFCSDLVDVVDKIEKEKHEKRMREIRAIAPPDYRSMPTWKLLRMLERMAPETWGRKKPFEK